jgi:hypothetical protein
MAIGPIFLTHLTNRQKTNMPYFLSLYPISYNPLLSSTSLNEIWQGLGGLADLKAPSLCASSMGLPERHLWVFQVRSDLIDLYWSSASPFNLPPLYVWVVCGLGNLLTPTSVLVRFSVNLLNLRSPLFEVLIIIQLSRLRNKDHGNWEVVAPWVGHSWRSIWSKVG